MLSVKTINLYNLIREGKEVSVAYNRLSPQSAKPAHRLRTS